MLKLEQDFEFFSEMMPSLPSIQLNNSFQTSYNKLKKWFNRFPFSADNTIFNDLYLIYLQNSKQFLDHRSPRHLSRLVLSIHMMQKKLLHAVTFSSHIRHLQIRWLPTQLHFPFSSKHVMGCIVAFNLIDRYEMFDEENILLALQKFLPQLKLVRESSYCHVSQYKNLKVFYFEIEKKNNASFSLSEQKMLKENLEEKVKNSIQTLSPNVFMRQNEEEIYKNVLVLSEEIQNLKDLPQAHITFEQQTSKEIIFQIILVHISPFHRFSLKERFHECSFVSRRVSIVKHIENLPVEGHHFSISLSRTPFLLRSDGSLDFYFARQKVVELIRAAIGEFRDYNGGIILKQQELLHNLKSNYSENYSELIETFFYGLTPLENQVLLPKSILKQLFGYFLENKKNIQNPEISKYTFKTHYNDKTLFIFVHSKDTSINKIIEKLIQEQPLKTKDFAYNFVENFEGSFFNCVLLDAETSESKGFVQKLQESLNQWRHLKKARQNLRIGLEYSFVSLDPRIGGEGVSGHILRLLFEGLTRFNEDGHIENALAETIEISSDALQYVFKLRTSFWNDGSPVTAHDFDYAWKKVLSPDFKTSFAYCFYPIKNAKEAKEGKVPLNQVGIEIIDDYTLKVTLTGPTPYFLQLTAYQTYAPVHRFIDQMYPQWPYQSERHYPCNGIFQLKINKANQGYQLVRNTLYWDSGKNSVDQITATLMTPSEAFQAFQKNELDWIGNPFGGWHSFYVPGKEDKLISLPNSSVCWLVFNTKSATFKHQKLRQVLAYAINRNQLCKDSFLPISPAFSPLLSCHRESALSPSLRFDPEMAIKLFNEALDEMGLTKEKLPPITIIFHDKGIREYTANCLCKQFKECLGIECEMKPLSWSLLFQKMTTSDFQMGLMHWTSWVDDPIYTLNTFKSDNQEINFSKWENREFQSYIDLSEYEVNPFQRSSYMLKAEQILCRELPVIPLFYQPFQAIIKKNFETINRISFHPRG